MVSVKILIVCFLGGKELIYVNSEARIALVQLHLPFLYAMDTGGHYKRNIQSFSQKTGVLLFNDLPMMGKMSVLNQVFGEKADPAIIHITGDAANSPFFYCKKETVCTQTLCAKRKLEELK